MSQGASYPISKLIARIIGGQSRSDFVHSLGYHNIDRGLRRLDPWLDEATGYERIIEQVVAAYPAHAEELQNAIAATKAMKAAEADAAFYERCKAEQEIFRPYIHVEGETTVPNGITMFAVSAGKWNLIEIPQTILNLPLDDQMAAAPELMRGYLRKHNGLCPFLER